MEWISVEDRMPEPECEFHGSEFSRDILMFSEDDGILFGYYFFPWRALDMEGFTVRGKGKYTSITHWMPIPEPPKD